MTFPQPKSAPELRISKQFLPQLSVCLNKVFHKLNVVKVDGTGIHLVNSGDLSHIVSCQLEVEDVR